jgi:hypothetical protein
MHVGRQVIQKVSETTVNGRVRYNMVIVEHQQMFCSRIHQSVDEVGHPRPAVGPFRSMEIFQRLGSHSRRDLVQGGDEVIPKAGRLVIVLIEGDPGHKGAVGRGRERAHPFGKERALTEPGGSAHEGEPAMQTFVE